MPYPLDEIKVCRLGKHLEIFVSARHTFGTDAVLLSNFSAPSSRDRAVDLGTGCGIIPFLWSLSKPPAIAEGVELQEDAAELVRRSIEHSGIENINIHHADLRHLDGILPASGYDLVVCNPPYRVQDSGKKNEDEGRRTARHEEQCTLSDVTAAAARLLRYGGRFCICHRPGRIPDIMETFRANGLEPKQLRLCAQRPDKAPFLCLVSAKKGGKPHLEVLPTLYVEDKNGVRTSEIRAIYGAYGEEAYE